MATCKQCEKSLCINEAHTWEKFSTQFSRKNGWLRKIRICVLKGSWAFLLTQMNFSIVAFLQLNKGNIWPLLGIRSILFLKVVSSMYVVKKASPTAKLN